MVKLLVPEHGAEPDPAELQVAQVVLDREERPRLSVAHLEAAVPAEVHRAVEIPVKVVRVVLGIDLGEAHAAHLEVQRDGGVHVPASHHADGRAR